MLLLPAVASGKPTLNTIHHCSALTLLKTLPDNSIDCVVSSPPYYALRSYLDNDDLNKPLEIGLEATPAAFIERLMTVFREVRRVLKSTGTVWVNLGDSYSGSSQTGGTASMETGKREHRMFALPKISAGLPPKSLLMIPARFAIAMQDDGWILRSEIVWAKRAPMPESVTDRPTKAHEMIYLFAKEPRYFYDQEAVREKAVNVRTGGFSERTASAMHAVNGGGKVTNVAGMSFDFRNLRDVWHLSPEPTSVEHYAAYPAEIPRRCILAGCPEKVCAVCGKPYEREVEKTGGTIGKGGWGSSNALVTGITRHGRTGDMKDGTYTRIDRGLYPACSCHAETAPGVVLDMFMGTGTTAVMARKLGRNYIGCDLNADYVALAHRRLADSDPFQHSTLSTGQRQLSLFAAL